MQGDPSIDHRVLSELAHVPIHLLIHQPEGERFVPHQRLIVRFGVRDRLLLRERECTAEINRLEGRLQQLKEERAGITDEIEKLGEPIGKPHPRS